MPALWDSKVTFVSVSQSLGLALCCLFKSVSGPFVTPCLIVSLGRRTKRKRKLGEHEEKGSKKKREEKKDMNKPPADFKPVQ